MWSRQSSDAVSGSLVGLGIVGGCNDRS